MGRAERNPFVGENGAGDLLDGLLGQIRRLARESACDGPCRTEFLPGNLKEGRYASVHGQFVAL
jgi:hypothetical protein